MLIQVNPRHSFLHFKRGGLQFLVSLILFVIATRAYLREGGGKEKKISTVKLRKEHTRNVFIIIISSK
jgi:hypothetical protein